MELVHVGDHAALVLGIRSMPLELMQPGNVEVYYEIKHFHAIKCFTQRQFLVNDMVLNLRIYHIG